MFSVLFIQKVYDPTVYDQQCGGGCLAKCFSSGKSVVAVLVVFFYCY